MDKKVLVYKRKRADNLSERQKRRRRQMQIKTAKMNIITNSNSNNDHLSQDINQEHAVAISEKNKSETISNIAVDADKEKITALQGYMQSLGGINLRDTLNEFMKATFTDDFVAKNITWKRGKGEKLHFRESAISVAFYEATRNIASLVDITLKKYSKEIKIAIKNASQRHYMTTIGRPSRVQDSSEKERAILARYE